MNVSHFLWERMEPEILMARVSHVSPKSLSNVFPTCLAWSWTARRLEPFVICTH